MRHWRWKPEVVNAAGKLSSNAAEYFGGPFFTDGGTLDAPKITKLALLTVMQASSSARI